MFLRHIFDIYVSSSLTDFLDPEKTTILGELFNHFRPTFVEVHEL